VGRLEEMKDAHVVIGGFWEYYVKGKFGSAFLLIPFGMENDFLVPSYFGEVWDVFGKSSMDYKKKVKTQ